MAARPPEKNRLARLGLLLLLSVGVACGSSKEKTMSKPVASDSVQQREALAKQLGLDIPASARVLGVERQSEGDALLRAKLQMTSKDWSTLLKSSSVDPEAMSPGTGGLLGPDHGWWDPHAAKNLRTGQALIAPGTYLNLGFDDSNADPVTVFIVKHGT
jgi:hypothetical protein